ncbi:RutC family protein [Buchnera aphidicola (Aphis glycines)]|uniref:RutC family protein n=1 Tax=Buchnera aphidicola (Aphis glycines) TaxID=1265350 RepID=A0A0M4HEB9_9GAMM|nr:Rid family detoxifying hydrolase [Buchnera aphidicola]ALD15311.1 RutC family protein [Buchnera aphidicola (Aphis glycines)]
MNIINTKNAPQPIGPYSQAIQFENFLIISGQIPIDVKSGFIPESIDEQTYIVLKNIKYILKKSKYQVKNIVKITIFTIDLNKIQIINEIYENFFLKNKSSFPARSCVEVKALPKNVKIEIEAMAYR